MKIWHEDKPYIPEDDIIFDYFTEDSMFFDIETTGFSPRSTSLYLIGCVSRTGNTLHIDQFFAESVSDEPALLNSFLNVLSNFQQIITFNGIGFDIPYLKEKCKCYAITEHFDAFSYLDIFKIIRTYKSILKLENNKQKTIEQFLGLPRNDLYNGGELIKIYHDFLKSPDNEEYLRVLKLHNYEDILGMISLLPILSYPALFSGRFSIGSVTVQQYKDYNNNDAKELVLGLNPFYSIPKRFSSSNQELYISGIGHSLCLSVKFHEGTLKYFVPDYKNYFYLPDEDTAIHKSVASYVDKNHRKQATAATCYLKKDSTFLPQYEPIFLPDFYENFHDKLSYFEFIDGSVSSDIDLHKYTLHLLQHLLMQK